jgi:DNA-binding transcriptional LysR family regulator
MELNQIEAFVTVAREGTFTQAAESLSLTQPAVSLRISTLEAELGGTLFERRGRRLQLTALGDTFLPYAERMLAVLADGRQAVKNVLRGNAGEVKIAAPTPFVLAFLVDVLDEFRHLYPAVDVLIRERHKTVILEMLHDNTIMLGLVNAPVFDTRLTQLARLQDPIRAVVSPKHALAVQSDTPTSIETICTHTIFRVSMFPEMTVFMDALVEQGRQGSGGAVIAVPMVMALRLVTLGQGITFLPESYVRESVERGDLIYLNVPDLPRLWSQPVLITRADRQLDAIHAAFVKVFRARWRGLLVE